MWNPSLRFPSPSLSATPSAEDGGRRGEARRGGRGARGWGWRSRAIPHPATPRLPPSRTPARAVPRGVGRWGWGRRRPARPPPPARAGGGRGGGRGAGGGGGPVGVVVRWWRRADGRAGVADAPGGSWRRPSFQPPCTERERALRLLLLVSVRVEGVLVCGGKWGRAGRAGGRDLRGKQGPRAQTDGSEGAASITRLLARGGHEMAVSDSLQAPPLREPGEAWAWMEGAARGRGIWPVRRPHR